MDGVICDFYGNAKKAIQENPNQKFPQSQWGFFLKLPEVKDSINSINNLKEKYDVWILTRPSARNVNCYTEKAQWIWDHLGFDMLEKLIISSDKSLVKGDYLIDDQNNANQDKFEGEWIKFGSDKFPDWSAVSSYLLNNLELDKQKLCESLIGKKESDLSSIKYETRIFEKNGSILHTREIKIDYNRLNIRISNNIINYAYFG